MTLRTKFFIILGVVVVFILFVVLVLVRGQGTKMVVETPVAASLPATSPIGTPTKNFETSSPSAAPAASPKTFALDATILARSFAERFGSFSNQSNFENIRELMPLMTPVMQVWADRLVADAQRTAAPNAPYYGITTRTLEVKASGGSEQSGVLDFIVKTQRREVKGKEAPRIFYQNLALTLKAVAGEWKVESATWK